MPGDSPEHGLYGQRRLREGTPDRRTGGRAAVCRSGGGYRQPCAAFVQILDGRAEIVLDGTPLRLKEGESLIMPAGTKHSPQAAERFKMLLMMIKG